MKIEKSRRVVESRPVCLDLNSHKNLHKLEEIVNNELKKVCC